MILFNDSKPPGRDSAQQDFIEQTNSRTELLVPLGGIPSTMNTTFINNLTLESNPVKHATDVKNVFKITQNPGYETAPLYSNPSDQNRDRDNASTSDSTLGNTTLMVAKPRGYTLHTKADETEAEVLRPTSPTNKRPVLYTKEQGKPAIFYRSINEAFVQNEETLVTLGVPNYPKFRSMLIGNKLAQYGFKLN